MTDQIEQPRADEPIVSKQERKRLRREERQKERDKNKRARQMRHFGKIAVYAIGVIILIAIAKYAFWLAGPKGTDKSASYPIQSRDHIEKFAAHPSYNSNPPTSGWHYGETAENGAHREEVADEYLIHNLEHGDIWIAYHPRISGEAEKELKKFGDESRLVVTPRSGNEHDVALVAWGHLDAFNLLDKPLDTERVRDFIKRYRNKGPEKVPAGKHLETEDEEEHDEDGKTLEIEN